jgi:hypothetical protein
VIFVTLGGLTAVAALARQRRTTRLGLAFTATIAAFALPWQVSWWPLPGLVGVGVYLAAGQLPGGLILTHLSRAVGVWPALLAQAGGFGALNLHGYPNGPVGVALTGSYGVLLGLLRVRARGLLACWIAHALADAVIFAFIVQAAAHQF